MLRALRLLVDDTPRLAGVVPFGRADPCRNACAPAYAAAPSVWTTGGCNIFTFLGQAGRFLHAADSGQVRGRTTWSNQPLYPPLAIREALVNAFRHQDCAIRGGLVSVTVYDDHLEVASSGFPT